uniref:Uncharacterized protein n=1 Tax=Oryza barthii TaxID=65489 RepID=A0A0D3H8B3_9ORYZ
MVEEAGGGAALPEEAVASGGGGGLRAAGADGAVESLHGGSHLLLLLMRLVHELLLMRGHGVFRWGEVGGGAGRLVVVAAMAGEEAREDGVRGVVRAPRPLLLQLQLPTTTTTGEDEVAADLPEQRARR